MIYEIQEITTDTNSGHTYVLVWFWPSEAAKLAGPESPYLINDFLMQLRPTGERLIFNAQGQVKLEDGRFIDPSERYEEIEVDERKIVRDAQGLPTRDEFGKLVRRSTGRKVLVRRERTDLPSVARKIFDRPVPMEMAANIEQYMQRATVNEYSGDHTHRPGSAPFRVKGVRQPQGEIVMQLDDAHDPHDILKHPGVAALRSQIANRKETREAEKLAGGPRR